MTPKYVSMLDGRTEKKERNLPASDLDEQNVVQQAGQSYPAVLQQHSFEVSNGGRSNKAIIIIAVAVLYFLLIKSLLNRYSPCSSLKSGISWNASSNRDIIIETKSNSVTGIFPLYDILSITTDSGLIDITVEPKSISIDDPRPATLHLYTKTGSIRVNTVTSRVLNRTYDTYIASDGGQLDVRIIHGKQTALNTKSGQIHAEIFPVGYDDTYTAIDARTDSGGIEVHLHPALSLTADPLGNLHSLYRSISGSVHVVYPDRWQGNVECSTLSGSMDLDWPGLEIVEHRRGPGIGESIRAVRGKGDGVLGMVANSGSVILRGESESSGGD